MTRMFTTKNNPGHAGFLNVRRRADRFIVEIGRYCITGPKGWQPSVENTTTLSEEEAAQLVAFITKKRRK